MGKNIVANTNETLFVDLDGTLVRWNHDPENIPDLVIPSVVAWVKSKFPCTLVITTSRTYDHAEVALIALRDVGITPSAMITDLPTGPRILVNDHRPNQPAKAIALNVVRDEGL